ncbi:MAG: helix-turn-helix transcriptional regulator [Halanaerobiales bacterium]|nr:helix-turn-helix transcriptional regulator [Halanaerobiales bacterium]
MVSSAKKILQAAVIDSLKKENKVTYRKIAESIDVHNSTIQKVSKGLRLLSQEKFNLLCKTWNINLSGIVEILELNDLKKLQRKSLLKILKAREVDLESLSAKTGISILDLNHIEREKRQPTDKEILKICEVLDIESHIITEGILALVFEIIEKGLKYIYMEPSAIEAVIKFLEAEI